jgi:hypothetical protein
VPEVVVKTLPNDAVPLTTGNAAFTGGLKTIAVGAVKTVVPPLTSSAVTETRRYFPESAEVMT